MGRFLDKSHRNVINYFGVGSEGKELYILMEFVQGESLLSLLKRQEFLPVIATYINWHAQSTFL